MKSTAKRLRFIEASLTPLRLYLPRVGVPSAIALRRAALLALLLTTPAAADTPEPGSAEAIARFTTDPRFRASIASVPESATVPSPSDFLGHVAGAAGELHAQRGIQAYYRALAAATPRVRVETIGRTEEGREISSP